MRTTLTLAPSPSVDGSRDASSNRADRRPVRLSRGPRLVLSDQRKPANGAKIAPLRAAPAGCNGSFSLVRLTLFGAPIVLSWKARTNGPGLPRGKQPKNVTSLRQRRLSYGAFPQPLKGDVPYADSRPELAGLSLGEKVRIYMSTQAWKDVMRPLLAALEADRPKKGPSPPTALRSLRAACSISASQARAPTAQRGAYLAGDRARATAPPSALTTSATTGNPAPAVKSRDGVPC